MSSGLIEHTYYEFQYKKNLSDEGGLYRAWLLEMVPPEVRQWAVKRTVMVPLEICGQAGFDLMSHLRFVDCTAQHFSRRRSNILIDYE